MNPRATLTICFMSEGVGEFQLSLDEETMTFSLTSETRGVNVPDELTQSDACEPNQAVFAARVVACVYGQRRVAAEVRHADLARVCRLLDVLRNTALPD